VVFPNHLGHNDTVFDNLFPLEVYSTWLRFSRRSKWWWKFSRFGS